MQQLQTVLWTKGVLLSPQHMQAQDRFIQELLRFKLSALTGFPWGFTNLDIDRAALEKGVFTLSRAAGMMPDGLPFEMPLGDTLPASRPFAADWTGDRTSLLVFLVLPDHRPGGRNVSGAGAERDTRYATDVLLRRDDNTGLSERPIQVARKSFRLLTEADSREAYIGMPVARVIRTATNQFQLDPEFIPPLLSIGASGTTLGIARRLVEILAARSATLSAARGERNRGIADFGSSDVANFWLLYTINSSFPLMRHLLETRHGHPVELYDAMISLAGALTTFSTEIQPGTLPSYDHSNLSECFGQLDHILRDLLNTVVPTNHVSLTLDPTGQSIYAVAIDQDRYLESRQVFLAVAADLKPDELARHVPQLVKVTSADDIQRFVSKSLPGLTLTHLAAPPKEIPRRNEYEYFAIDPAGTAWDSVRQTRKLAAYVPSELRNPRLELVILLPSRPR